MLMLKSPDYTAIDYLNANCTQLATPEFTFVEEILLKDKIEHNLN
jgi:hypothetical protein